MRIWRGFWRAPAVPNGSGNVEPSLYVLLLRFLRRRPVWFGLVLGVGFLWAFASLTASLGANSHYRRRREHGDWHAAAQRNLLNRMLGQLFHCLQTRQHFDEQRAFTSPISSSLTAAA